MTKFGISMVAVAALVGAAVATPHPECEPCAAAATVDLAGLTANGKYLCCDLTCATNPVAGCGMFGLPAVCKGCYDGDDTPAYDSDPVDDDVVDEVGDPETTEPAAAPTPSPVMPVAASTSSPVTPVTAPTPAPVMPVAAPTPAPVMPVAAPTPAPVMPVAAPTPAPVMPVAAPTPAPVMPVAATTPSPVMPVVASTPSPVMPVTAPTPSPVMPVTAPTPTYSYDYDEGPTPTLCTACDNADSALSDTLFLELEADGMELVCDFDCYGDSTLEGCGFGGLDTGCRAVDIPLLEDNDDSSDHSLCTACDNADSALSDTLFLELEADGMELVCDDDCYDDSTLEGCGFGGLDTGCRAVDIPLLEDSDSATDSGTGVGTDGGNGSGTDSGTGVATDGGNGSGTDSGTGVATDGGNDSGTDSETGVATDGGNGSGSDSVEGSSDVTRETCTENEILSCADLTVAQVEALAMYDNGGKVIVCDPTCSDGFSDPIHCNYFGLGQRCRGCGTCSSCTPCP